MNEETVNDYFFQLRNMAAFLELPENMVKLQFLIGLPCALSTKLRMCVARCITSPGIPTRFNVSNVNVSATYNSNAQKMESGL